MTESRNKYPKSLPQDMIHNRNEISGYQNIVEIFNKFFSDIFKVSPFHNVIIDYLVTKSFFHLCRKSTDRIRDKHNHNT